jgi:cytidine deaminase
LAKAKKSKETDRATLGRKEFSTAGLFDEAALARQSAHAPYSKFKVGAALQTKNGTVFIGCNVENASYGGTVCAERVAILKAVSEGHHKFTGIVVVTDEKIPAFPCALCLQTMAEFFSGDVAVGVANLGGIKSEFKFSDLLPHRFGPNEYPKESSKSKSSHK